MSSQCTCVPYAFCSLNVSPKHCLIRSLMIRVHWHYTALNIMKNMAIWANGLMEQNLTKLIFYSDFIRHTIQRLNFCWMPKTNNFLHWIVGQWSTRVCPILTSHCYCVKRPLLTSHCYCVKRPLSVYHFTKFKGIFERRIQYPLISAYVIDRFNRKKTTKDSTTELKLCDQATLVWLLFRY